MPLEEGVASYSAHNLVSIWAETTSALQSITQGFSGASCSFVFNITYTYVYISVIAFQTASELTN